MQFGLIIRTLGLLLMVFSLVFLVPIGVDLIYQEGETWIFATAFLIVLGIGTLLWGLTQHTQGELRTLEGFVIVVLTWTLLSTCAAIPFILSDQFPSLIDALFEAVSGLTTTGTEVLSHLDGLPHSLLFYHQFLEFIGGLGVIVLALAIMPILGVGGMQLYRAEMPGVVKDNRIAPRVAHTAKALWGIYLGLTLVCFLSYRIAGMTWFDAICEAFSTVSTGGFSIHDQSFRFYQQPAIPIIAIVFMILGGINFRLHFALFRTREFLAYFYNYECRIYLSLLLMFSGVVSVSLLWFNHDQPWQPLVGQATFTAVSMMTTTGFTNANFSEWTRFLPVLIMMMALLGGCAGSTTGGIKIIRLLLLQKEGLRSLRYLIHPRAIISINFGGNVLPEEMMQSMRGFLALFLFVYSALFLLVMASGVDFHTTFAAVTACFSNVGASIGTVASNYSHLPAFAKAVLIFAMLAGRIEIMALMVVFMPSFWRG